MKNVGSGSAYAIRHINTNLRVLPHEITTLTQLEMLDLRDNYLSRIPSTITRLTDLSTICLSGNHMTVPMFGQNIWANKAKTQRLLAAMSVYFAPAEQSRRKIGAILLQWQRRNREKLALDMVKMIVKIFIMLP